MWYHVTPNVFISAKRAQYGTGLFIVLQKSSDFMWEFEIEVYVHCLYD